MPNVLELNILEAMEAVASPDPSSGAGVAAALVLALSASCALKAIHITLKHDRSDGLKERGDQLLLHRDRALESARLDAELFRNYLRDKQPRDAAMLVKAAQDFQQLAREMAEELAALEGKVYSSVVADHSAAKTLHAAATAVGGLILHDNRELRAAAIP